MRLSRTIAYAIHATMYLAQSEPGRAVPCREMAQGGRMPERFLLQVLRNLVTHGVLRSTRGVDGGYSLARPSEQITFREIIEAFDNPLVPEAPILDGQSMAVRNCILDNLGRASQAAKDQLQTLTVADLMQADGGRSPEQPEPHSHARS